MFPVSQSASASAWFVLIFFASSRMSPSWTPNWLSPAPALGVLRPHLLVAERFELLEGFFEGHGRDFHRTCYTDTSFPYAPVAQLDRAPAF